MNNYNHENILEMTKLSKTFPGVIALDSVDFDVRKGEIHALVGENGAGKSTLVKILSGVYTKNSGEIKLNNDLVDISTPLDASKLGISTIYQELNLVPFLDSIQNIWAGREEKFSKIFLDRKNMINETKKLMDLLSVEIPLTEPVKNLPVAQQQMVAIARAISEDTRILVMDEPTARLAAKEIDNLFSLIKRLSKQGIAVVYISHRLEEIFNLANRITVLKNGKLQGTFEVNDIKMSHVVNLMVGEELKEEYHKQSLGAGDELLVCSNISDKNILRNISFTLRKGEILGIVGPVGSGRSELLKAIFGENPLEGGTIKLNDIHFSPKNPSQAINKGIALVPEDRRGEGLIMHMNIVENITLPTFKQWSPFGFIRPRKERNVANEKAQQLDIRMSGITQVVRYLSGGNQQKVVLGKWLVKKSNVFLLDEPTAGIDVGAKNEIYKLVAELAENGAGVIYVTSEVPEIMRIADRILVMRSGQIIKELTREEATEEKILTYVLSGEIGSV
jgi:ribose transport system ATP-binding protein